MTASGQTPDRGRSASGLTRVDVVWIRQRLENRIRFGRPQLQRDTGRHRRAVFFTAGSVFAFLRWESRGFGTALSRIDILRAVFANEGFVTVPDVHPGGDSLLCMRGWPRVEKVLEAIETVEALRIDPADAAPDYWRHVHNRLCAGERPQPYTKTRHHAFLRRRQVLP